MSRASKKPSTTNYRARSRGTPGPAVGPRHVLNTSGTPVEVYSRRRMAELLLNGAVDAEDYALMLREVRKLGIDPATVKHTKPNDV